ncbi:hypothetical protein GWK08_16665 [Leptobacterium flavescens]|uniref:Uncharacterized protein n=1 Tax=Leptobacterium flavescens TaxID=472055 RepID=A0A6P0UTC2_9FLAO|nr:hypothetical protein [Leptobacterium flavescens]NER15089.1 hypothetical protein [Leptobacterium flavescens]
MKINIVTSELKKANRYLNLSLLIFALFMLLFFISFWFPNNTLIKNLYAISVFVSGGSILFSVILLIYRQSCKKVIDLDQSEIMELTINSHIDPSKILKLNDIEYAGNQIKVVSDSKIYEIDKSTAFELIKNGSDLNARAFFKKTSRFDFPPKELFNELMSILWAAS